MPPVRTSAVKPASKPTRSSPRKATRSLKATNVLTSLSISTSTPPTLSKPVPASDPSRVILLPHGWVPKRAPNAFILFRKWRAEQDQSNAVEVDNQKVMSDVYAMEWGLMSALQKAPYFTLWHNMDALLKARFPWYKYTKGGRKINKTLGRVKTDWTPQEDHQFVIDAEGVIVYAEPSLEDDVPAVHTLAPLVKEEDEDEAMEDFFPITPVASPARVIRSTEQDHHEPSRAHHDMHQFRRPRTPEGFYAKMDYTDVGRIAPKSVVQSNAMDYEERGPTNDPFYITPAENYEPTLWADYHARLEDKAFTQVDYPDCSDFDDLNLAIYTDEDQGSHYNSYVSRV